MLRALGGREIPPADLARAKADDSERTKMLKEVLKSVTKFSAESSGKEKNESAAAAAQLTLKAAEEEEEKIKQAVQASSNDPCDWGFLSSDQENFLKSTVASDDHIMGMDAGEEFRELLKYTGERIHRHSTSLSSSRPFPEPPPHIDSSPADGIYLVPRHEAEDIVAGGATDHKRRDQAVWSWVQDNVKFKELQALDKQFEGTNKYEDLRVYFDAHHSYHPMLTELTDHTLVDGNLWEKAVFDAMFPKEVQAKTAAPTAQSSFFAPKVTSNKRGGLGNSGSRPNLAPGSPKNANKVSWAKNAKGGGSAAGSNTRASKMAGGKF